MLGQYHCVGITRRHYYSVGQKGGNNTVGRSIRGHFYCVGALREDKYCVGGTITVCRYKEGHCYYVKTLRGTVTVLFPLREALLLCRAKRGTLLLCGKLLLFGYYQFDTFFRR